MYEQTLQDTWRSEPAEEAERWSGGQKESENMNEWPKDTRQAGGQNFKFGLP